MAHAILTPAVRSVLRRATVKPSFVRLSPEDGDMEAGLYREVDRALKAAGGKWDRRQRAHLFKSDPCAKLAAAIKGAKLMDDKVTRQAFYTPADVAEFVVMLGDVRGCHVYEPSAGDGSLADACRTVGAASVECGEICEDAAAILREKGYPVVVGDFLKLGPVKLYECVVMNPPFSRGSDLKHVRHALRFVQPGGVLTAVMQNKHSRETFAELAAGSEFDVYDLGNDAFKSAGTSIGTCVLNLSVRL